MGERSHRVLAVVAAVILVVGFLEWRSLRGSATGALMPPIPNPQLTGLLPYSTPLSDTLRGLPVAGDSLVLRRDPFAGQLASHDADSQSAVADAPAPKHEGPTWRVTTTLMSGTRRAALINDALIYVGDRLPDGSKLTIVERDHVVVTDQKGAAHTVAVAKEGNG